jgi:hypothetical protein
MARVALRSVVVPVIAAGLAFAVGGPAAREAVGGRRRAGAVRAVRRFWRVARVA